MIAGNWDLYWIERKAFLNNDFVNHVHIHVSALRAVNQMRAGMGGNVRQTIRQFQILNRAVWAVIGVKIRQSSMVLKRGPAVRTTGEKVAEAITNRTCVELMFAHCFFTTTSSFPISLSNCVRIIQPAWHTGNKKAFI
jgi:hypothetical protein